MTYNVSSGTLNPTRLLLTTFRRELKTVLFRSSFVNVNVNVNLYSTSSQ